MYQCLFTVGGLIYNYQLVVWFFFIQLSHFMLSGVILNVFPVLFTVLIISFPLDVV